MFLKKAAFACILLFACSGSFAQEKFVEGIITYTVTITGKVPTPANEPSLTETKSGTMTIYVKEDNVRQDIRLEDGYVHSRISNYTTGKDIILQNINTTRYAIEVNLDDQRKKNAAFYNAVLQPGNGRKQMGSFEAQEAVLKYRDGSVFNLYYIPAYTLAHPGIFDRSPEIAGIPAQFDIPMSNGFSTHFELNKISLEPVANAFFRIPEGYRIISKKEYDRLLK